MVPLILAVVVASSASLSMVKPSSLDTVEYGQVVQLTVAATDALHQCNTETVDTNNLLSSAEFVQEYETHLPKAEHKLQAAREVVYLVKQFQQRENASTRYCYHKLSEIQSVSRTLARSLGGLHQFDICDSNFEDRFKLYETSYKKEMISKDEFQELVTDIEHIAKTDRAACSTENAVKLDQAMKLISETMSVINGL